jgi:hypothetical protein
VGAGGTRPGRSAWDEAAGAPWIPSLGRFDRLSRGVTEQVGDRGVYTGPGGCGQPTRQQKAVGRMVDLGWVGGKMVCCDGGHEARDGFGVRAGWVIWE